MSYEEQREDIVLAMKHTGDSKGLDMFIYLTEHQHMFGFGFTCSNGWGKAYERFVSRFTTEWTLHMAKTYGRQPVGIQRMLDTISIETQCQWAGISGEWKTIQGGQPVRISGQGEAKRFLRSVEEDTVTYEQWRTECCKEMRIWSLLSPMLHGPDNNSSVPEWLRESAIFVVCSPSGFMRNCNRRSHMSEEDATNELRLAVNRQAEILGMGIHLEEGAPQ